MKKVLIFKVLMLYHDSVYDEEIKDIKLSDIKTWVHDALAIFGKRAQLRPLNKL